MMELIRAVNSRSRQGFGTKPTTAGFAVGRLSARMPVGSREPSNMPDYVEAEILRGMLGFDLAALRAEAAAVIPCAKAWKDDVTDDQAGPEGATGEEETDAEAAAAAGEESP